jgi:hypothetical protein
MKPFSEACERNRGPIFAPGLAHLVWQPSDIAENMPGIRMWIAESGAPNLRPPLKLDVQKAWTALYAEWWRLPGKWLVAGRRQPDACQQPLARIPPRLNRVVISG